LTEIKALWYILRFVLDIYTHEKWKVGRITFFWKIFREMSLSCFSTPVNWI